jgi:hypothetical protein
VTTDTKVFGYEQFHLYYDTVTEADIIQSARNSFYVSTELGYSSGNYTMLRARSSSTTLYTWEQFFV